MFISQEKEKIKQYYNLALRRIKEKHINCFKGHIKPVFLISDTYPGVWLEHAYDSVFFAKMDENYLERAKNPLNLFDVSCPKKYSSLLPESFFKPSPITSIP